MKSVNILIIAFARFFAVLFIAFIALSLFSCEFPYWQTTKVVAVEKYHATRVWVVYKDRDGKYRKASLFQSDTINVFGTVVYADDYLSGRKPYGPLPGQEKEYQEYLKKRTVKAS